MDFTPTLSKNPQLRKAMEKFATDLAINELVNSIVAEHPMAHRAAFHLIAGSGSINPLEQYMDDMVADMVMDSFYKMLDMMRDTMKEYKPYIIEAMEEAE